MNKFNLLVEPSAAPAQEGLITSFLYTFTADSKCASMLPKAAAALRGMTAEEFAEVKADSEVPDFKTLSVIQKFVDTVYVTSTPIVNAIKQYLAALDNTSSSVEVKQAVQTLFDKSKEAMTKAGEELAKKFNVDKVEELVTAPTPNKPTMVELGYTASNTAAILTTHNKAVAGNKWILAFAKSVSEDLEKDINASENENLKVYSKLIALTNKLYKKVDRFCFYVCRKVNKKA